MALQTVSLSLERHRRRLQAQVWTQYLAKVCGLVGALEQIVATDRGRASELAQARKQALQVRLAATQARHELALAETRLRRYVGPELPELPPLGGLWVLTPPLETLGTLARQAPEIARLDAEAQAADRLTEATRAGQGPQLAWQLMAQRNAAGDRGAQYQAGLQLSLPLWAPQHDPALQAARQRAEAARLQREDQWQALRARLGEVHLQAEHAFGRAQEVAQVLRASERVREDTTLLWRQLGRRSLFDVIAAEAEHFNLRLAYVDALHDGQQAVALLWSLAGGVTQPLR
nr:TolC family protein [Ideonella livida]